ncbi:MAG: hypothetical protein LBE81_11980 [Azonexus sp.]|jgi:hypothetical protein|uniref:hypothetical protein n=1 Tax=Azonexus sp. TaxID=1872668 RepID=UPI0028215A12|nr:hypothetical protein [Azonexus sp.]MDR0777338.1 hypothetical protein [Azonexus sp.]
MPRKRTVPKDVAEWQKETEREMSYEEYLLGGYSLKPQEDMKMFREVEEQARANLRPGETLPEDWLGVVEVSLRDPNPRFLQTFFQS